MNICRQKEHTKWPPQISRVAFLKASVYGCLRLFLPPRLRSCAIGMEIVPRGASCQGDVPLRARC